MSNELYEKGELPPVGEKVEYTWTNKPTIGIQFGEWVIGKVIHYHDGFVWTSDNGLREIQNTKFRPIKSDRENAIEEMIKISYTPAIINNRSIMGALYDAGYRKVENKNE